MGNLVAGPAGPNLTTAGDRYAYNPPPPLPMPSPFPFPEAGMHPPNVAYPQSDHLTSDLLKIDDNKQFYEMFKPLFKEECSNEGLFIPLEFKYVNEDYSLGQFSLGETGYEVTLSDDSSMADLNFRNAGIDTARGIVLGRLRGNKFFALGSDGSGGYVSGVHKADCEGLKLIRDAVDSDIIQFIGRHNSIPAMVQASETDVQVISMQDFGVQETTFCPGTTETTWKHLIGVDEVDIISLSAGYEPGAALVIFKVDDVTQLLKLSVTSHSISVASSTILEFEGPLPVHATVIAVSGDPSTAVVKGMNLFKVDLTKHRVIPEKFVCNVRAFSGYRRVLEDMEKAVYCPLSIDELARQFSHSCNDVLTPYENNMQEKVNVASLAESAMQLGEVDSGVEFAEFVLSAPLQITGRFKLRGSENHNALLTLPDVEETTGEVMGMTNEVHMTDEIDTTNEDGETYAISITDDNGVYQKDITHE